MKTELRDDNIPAASLSPAEETPAGSFGRVLKNRSFLLLWLAQLLSQIVFNAANYGVIAIVTAVTHSTVLVGLAIISFTLPAVPFSLLAGVYVDYLDKRLTPARGMLRDHSTPYRCDEQGAQGVRSPPECEDDT